MSTYIDPNIPDDQSSDTGQVDDVQSTQPTGSAESAPSFEIQPKQEKQKPQRSPQTQQMVTTLGAKQTKAEELKKQGMTDDAIKLEEEILTELSGLSATPTPVISPTPQTMAAPAQPVQEMPIVDVPVQAQQSTPEQPQPAPQVKQPTTPQASISAAIEGDIDISNTQQQEVEVPVQPQQSQDTPQISNVHTIQPDPETGLMNEDDLRKAHQQEVEQAELAADQHGKQAAIEIISAIITKLHSPAQEKALTELAQTNSAEASFRLLQRSSLEQFLLKVERDTEETTDSDNVAARMGLYAVVGLLQELRNKATNEQVVHKFDTAIAYLLKEFD